MSLDMSLDEAKRIIQDDTANFVAWAVAAATIAELTKEEDRLSPETLKLLLLCLKRKSLAVSTATCALYGWTGRPWPGDIFLNSHDPIEWENYLRENQLLK